MIEKKFKVAVLSHSFAFISVFYLCKSVSICVKSCLFLTLQEPCMKSASILKSVFVWQFECYRNSLILIIALLIFQILCVSIVAQDTNSAKSFPVNITIDASTKKGELKPIWRFFGADEPNYAYMKDGKKLIKELGTLRPNTIYFRTHNLLTTGDGTPALKWGSTNAYTEDANGNPVYNWTIVDRIFDTYLQRGVKPYVQIGFMPKALSTKPDPYQHSWTPTAKYDEIYTGWAYPPKDFAKWAELVFQWTKHCVEKYGRKEVESWYFEVWTRKNFMC